MEENQLSQKALKETPTSSLEDVVTKKIFRDFPFYMRGVFPKYYFKIKYESMYFNLLFNTRHLYMNKEVPHVI